MYDFAGWERIKRECNTIDQSITADDIRRNNIDLCLGLLHAACVEQRKALGTDKPFIEGLSKAFPRVMEAIKGGAANVVA